MYKIAIYSIKSPLASITASMRPRTGPQDLGFLHGLKFLLDTFDQFVLHLAWNLASASLNCPPPPPPIQKSPLDSGLESLEAKCQAGQNQQSCCSAKVAFFSMYDKVLSPVATHMAFQQLPYISRAVRTCPKPSGTPPC